MINDAMEGTKVRIGKIDMDKTFTKIDIEDRHAAKNGKDVTVFIELQARFDEANNIKWTNMLRAEGIKVVSGVPGLKVHSKLTLIRRDEGLEKLVDYCVVVNYWNNMKDIMKQPQKLS